MSATQDALQGNPLAEWQKCLNGHLDEGEQCSRLIGELFQILLEINNEKIEDKILRAVINVIPKDAYPTAVRDIEEILTKYKYEAKPAKRSIPARQRFRILLRDGFACQYCGRKAPEVKLHIDHVQPISKGGKTTDDNLKTACQECNTGKSNTVLCQKLETN